MSYGAKKPFERKPDSGMIFPNERKESDKHPDLTGSALIGGVEYWVSSWDKGNGRLSLAFTRKDTGQAQATRTFTRSAPTVKGAPSTQKATPATRGFDNDTDDTDDIPF